MKPSHEVLKEAFQRSGVKAVAAELNVSSVLLYKWCQPSEDSPTETAAGARNPLDRLFMIYQVTKDPAIIQWLCGQADGYFVSNPDQTANDDPVAVLNAVQSMIKEFSETLNAISMSYSDKVITPREADRIRKEWDELKSIGEGFVRACEQGAYQNHKGR